ESTERNRDELIRAEALKQIDGGLRRRDRRPRDGHSPGGGEFGEAGGHGPLAEISDDHVAAGAENRSAQGGQEGLPARAGTAEHGHDGPGLAGPRRVPPRIMLNPLELLSLETLDTLPPPAPGEGQLITLLVGGRLIALWARGRPRGR